jgi:hypothetical protein
MGFSAQGAPGGAVVAILARERVSHRQHHRHVGVRPDGDPLQRRARWGDRCAPGSPRRIPYPPDSPARSTAASCARRCRPLASTAFGTAARCCLGCSRRDGRGNSYPRGLANRSQPGVDEARPAAGHGGEPARSRADFLRSLYSGRTADAHVGPRRHGAPVRAGASSGCSRLIWPSPRAGSRPFAMRCRCG